MSRLGAVLLFLGLAACSRNAPPTPKDPASTFKNVEVSVQPEAKPTPPAGPLLAQAPGEARASTPASSPADIAKLNELESQIHGDDVAEQASHDVDLAIKQRIRRAAMADSSL